ncbi:hypothetical protein [Achromobacter aloeverae]|uniref:Uncharacterized protein n=1 Tax=Achromobacter aloeverae TaxID=1750518 RepID=A0A4Q1HQ51_9BURK|nr:hypothetical protein [Achromobacter aloeverae]RXN93069.1 hypothetical protein C7R54_04960 [Achromobacter aloeverae]
MEPITVEALNGKLAAQSALLSALIRVLPLDALGALEAELTRDLAQAQAGPALPPAALEAYGKAAEAHLAAVREASTKKAWQAPSTNGAG